MTKEQKRKDVENIVVSVGEGVIKEVPPKKKRKRRFLLLYLAIIVFAVYTVYALVSQHQQIAEKEAQLASLNRQIAVQEIKNDEITNIYNLSDEENKDYIEQKAREDGYLHAGERVFVNVSGE